MSGKRSRRGGRSVRSLKAMGEFIIGFNGANFTTTAFDDSNFVSLTSFQWRWMISASTPTGPPPAVASLTGIKNGFHFFLPLHNYIGLLQTLSSSASQTGTGSIIRPAQNPSVSAGGVRVGLSASLSDCAARLVQGDGGSQSVFQTHKIMYSVVRFVNTVYQYPSGGATWNVWVPEMVDTNITIKNWTPVINAMEIAPVWNRPEDVMLYHHFLLSSGANNGLATFNASEQVVMTSRTLHESDELYLYIQCDNIAPPVTVATDPLEPPYGVFPYAFRLAYKVMLVEK